MAAATPLHLVLVDDDSDTRMMYRCALEAYGMEVTTAGSALAAMQEVRTRTPDAVVSDLMLPGVSGLALCRALRDDPATSRLPLLAVTGRDRGDEIGEAYDAGFDLVLIKPVLPDELCSAVRRVLTRRPR
jgi:DNA-binding response OmpR family regulator